jgi:hypothetical protein
MNTVEWDDCRAMNGNLAVAVSLALCWWERGSWPASSTFDYALMPFVVL